MGGRRSTSELIRIRWSLFGSVADLNGPKTGPPGELFQRSLLDPIRTRKPPLWTLKFIWTRYDSETFIAECCESPLN